MRLVGYGEDPLTLRALTKELSTVLAALGDTTPLDRVLVVYRPSFGRNSFRRGGATIRSEFGEFDAIVATDSATYLVEAKWDGSSERAEGTIILRSEQVRRHEVLRWYLEFWARLRPKSWKDFQEVCREQFEVAFPGMAIPDPETKLALNLEFILKLLADRPRIVRDVLLYCTVSQTAFPVEVEPSGFTVVGLRFERIGGAGYVDL